MKAMNILRNFLLPMAFAALAACSTDEQPLAPQEITLTTPVLTLADATAQAAVSRAGEGTVPMEEVSMIGLSPRLTKGLGQEALGNQGSYVYTRSAGWKPGNTLTVTSGPGAYYAAARAIVSLKANEDERPLISSLVYTWQGSLLASEDGTFVLDGAMTPVTAAIWVKLKDANGNDITNADELGSYRIRYTGVKSSNLSYRQGDDGTYGYEITPDAEVKSADATIGYGWWYPATYGTAGSSWELFSIEHNGTTYPVAYTGELTLEAGKLYTFTVQLNGDKHATLVGDVSVSDFATGEQINIER